MSNDLILQLKNQLAEMGGGVDEDTRAVAGNGGASKRISIDGGVFRKIVGGKEMGAIEDRHMNVIFVKLAHNPTRMYYTDAYKKGAKVSPVCWASEAKTPDPDCPAPQAKSCDTCPMSVKGSSPMGVGSACRLSWRTAVVLPNDPSGDVMQLVLPATSCFGEESTGRWPFRPYVQMLASNNISVGRVITKMQFDTASSVPKLLFSPIGPVDARDVDTILTQAKSPAAEAAVKLRVYIPNEAAAPAVTAAAPSAPVAEEEGEEPSPKLRESKKTETPPAPDLANVMAKWAKK
jgi:hypothetical protein